MQQAMVDDDPKERSRCEQGIDPSEGAVLDSAAHVARKQIMEGAVLLLKEQLGHRMPF